MVPSATETGQIQEMNERSQWALDAPEPPPPWHELVGLLRKSILPDRTKPPSKHVLSFVNGMFPILHCFRSYKAMNFKKDLMAGLTLASLCIPQSIGYATLAKLDPQYGLYTSLAPPVIYSVMGTSREIAIGPVAVVSLLLSSMAQKLEDPASDPIAYRKLILTITFFPDFFKLPLDCLGDY
ncbi:hypothetical protein SLA2020_410510 [Shorea laevis]